METNSEITRKDLDINDDEIKKILPGKRFLVICFRMSVEMNTVLEIQIISYFTIIYSDVEDRDLIDFVHYEVSYFLPDI